MKIYESPIERMRAIYQCPAASDMARVLELHVGDFGPILNQNWPAKLAISCRLVNRVGELRYTPKAESGFIKCEALLNEVLPFASGSFDMAILHYTLDDLATGLSRRKSRVIAEHWLREIARVICPEGLVVGCGSNGCSPIPALKRYLSKGQQSVTNRSQPVMSVLSCAKILDQTGFHDIEVFNLLTDTNNPRSLASIDPLLSRRVFEHELQSIRESLGFGGYLIRKLLLHLSADRFLEPNIFYWGFRRC